MTITLHWWMLPAALAILGLVVAILDKLWDDRHSSGGYFGSAFNGCLGVVACGVLWVAAAGICIGRWLA